MSCRDGHRLIRLTFGRNQFSSSQKFQNVAVVFHFRITQWWNVLQKPTSRLLWLMWYREEFTQWGHGHHEVMLRLVWKIFHSVFVCPQSASWLLSHYSSLLRLVWKIFHSVFVCPQSASWLLSHYSSLLRHGRFASYWNAFLFQKYFCCYNI